MSFWAYCCLSVVMNKFVKRTVVEFRLFIQAAVTEAVVGDAEAARLTAAIPEAFVIAQYLERLPAVVVKVTLAPWYGFVPNFTRAVMIEFTVELVGITDCDADIRTVDVSK